MAQADLEWVQDVIEDDAAEKGFAEQEIRNRIDAGQTKFRIAETYWRKRAQHLLYLVNTSESGSSRGNDALYSRALAEADRLAGLADKDEADEVTSTEGRLSSIEINRV